MARFHVVLTFEGDIRRFSCNALGDDHREAVQNQIIKVRRASKLVAPLGLVEATARSYQTGRLERFGSEIDTGRQIEPRGAVA